MKLSNLVDRTLLKFIMVGVVNTLFGSAIMFAMYNLLHCSYWVSSAANYVCGSILSFLQFASGSGHWCVCQRPPGGTQRPPSLRYFDRLNDDNVVLCCPLHNSIG